VKYISTRGAGEPHGFEEVLLAGLARDGGLYVPEAWPHLGEHELAGLAGLAYPQAAFRVLSPYVREAVDAGDFRAMLDAAYATFAHPATVPLVQIGPNDFLLELFHGPTMAFKDVAMQLLARLMDHVLARRGSRITVVGATSGDTGSAAIAAFKGRAAVDVFILHPKGRVSEVQRRQMTTVEDANVHNIALEGTFDDCQAVVKALFNDLDFRDRLALAGVNSINWARIMAQSVYYASAAANLGAPHRGAAFSVPTGNFGDIYAGYVAAHMGLPVARLIVATNVNDILVRALQTGRYALRHVTATQSPSMDIQVASNFERLIFDLAGRDGNRVADMMEALSATGGFTLDEAMLNGARALFCAHRSDEAETTETIRAVHRSTGILVDPHTAVAVAAAQKARAAGDIAAETPIVILSTAHPAKFPDAVEKAVGFKPSLPERAGDLHALAERYEALPNDAAAIARFIESRAHASGREAAR
jgi:threonine synthase